ncbi:hypothetical protein [Helicobacter sp. 23-1045]
MRFFASCENSNNLVDFANEIKFAESISALFLKFMDCHENPCGFSRNDGVGTDSAIEIQNTESPLCFFNFWIASPLPLARTRNEELCVDSAIEVFALLFF